MAIGKQQVTAMVSAVFLGLSIGISVAEDAAVKVGNPTLARWPASGDPAAPNGDAYARPRSAWDMYYFNGRIYIGSGDYWADSGPTDVWTYNGTGFVKEYTVDDEMIWDFFEFDNKLFVPGNDATEDWSFENLYINDPHRVPNPGWIKLRTLPGGLHSFDVALFKGKLYASITTDGSTPDRALVSTDMGQTWTTFISEYSSFVVFGDFMFVEGASVEGTSYYKYDGTTLQKVTPNLYVFMDRKARFRDGVLYAQSSRYMLGFSPLGFAPLYFLPAGEIKNGGEVIKVAKFRTDIVRDFVVRGLTCYVMTAQEITKDVAYKGRIYSSSSSSLTDWLLVSEFTVPGMPLSFEIMNNKFYVGLGSRYDSSVGWDYLIGPQSGSIWEITPAGAIPTPANGCAAAPLIGCHTPGKAIFLIKDREPAGASAGDKVIWQFLKGPSAVQADFGDPTSTADYTLCLYTGTASNEVMEIQVPASGRLWARISTKGYLYKDAGASPDGVFKLLLKGGDASKILLKARDGNIPMPALPLDEGANIIVQLHNTDNSNCWSSTFPVASIKKNTSTKFKAKIL